MKKKQKIEICIKLPKELIIKIDRIVELIGYKKREKFIESATRRLINQYEEKTRLISTYTQT